jgi:hypothetical protein
MTEARHKYGTGKDKKLFQRLAGHIEPRPNDPTWKSNQNLKRIDEILKAFGAVFCAGGCIVMGVSLLSRD